MAQSPEQQVRELTEELIHRWLNDKEQDSLFDRLSEQCSWIDASTNQILKEKQEIHQYFKKYKSTIYDKLNVRSIRDMTLQTVGSCVVVIAELLIFYYTQKKEQIVTTIRFTVVWQKEKEDWKILHFHDSIPITLFEISESEGIQPVSERVKRASRTDTVTGISNMEGFCDKSVRILEKNRSCYALIKLSIKDFRYINQRYGYSMGDTVLQSIGKNLQKSCKDDEACGRIEKDMFALLYKYKSKKNMSLRMEDIRKNLLDKKLLCEMGMELDFTAGIYVIPKSEKGHIKNMLDKALMAQQQVAHHQSGSHYLYYDENMMKKLIFNNQIINYAPTAMKNEEFQFYIQPQFDIKTGKVVAGEALCRWEKEKGKFVPPDMFIPLFEDYGIILEFDFYMLNKLCQKMQKWMISGHPIKPISINQSRLHIGKKDYIKEFCKVVDQYGIPHPYIAFELTESAFVERYDSMIELATKLHKKGFQLAIDDFGTGFASMNLLSVISADILKVDKSLLDSIHTKRGKTVLQKVIELAHQMEMTVICEGVERMEQWEQLKYMNCDLGQGYLVGKPIPADEFEKIWIQRSERKKEYEVV